MTMPISPTVRKGQEAVFLTSQLENAGGNSGNRKHELTSLYVFLVHVARIDYAISFPCISSR